MLITQAVTKVGYMLYRNAEPVLRAHNADENALYKSKKKRRKRHHQQQPHAQRLSVEPVLRTVLDGKATLDTTAVLGRHTTGSVYPVDLVVSPRISAIGSSSSIQLQPRDAAEAIGALDGSRRRSTLSIDLALDTTKVRTIGLEHEERDAGSGELVVA
jgi:hypothetical protein